MWFIHCHYDYWARQPHIQHLHVWKVKTSLRMSCHSLYSCTSSLVNGSADELWDWNDQRRLLNNVYIGMAFHRCGFWYVLVATTVWRKLYRTRDTYKEAYGSWCASWGHRVTCTLCRNICSWRSSCSVCHSGIVCVLLNKATKRINRNWTTPFLMNITTEV